MDLSWSSKNNPDVQGLGNTDIKIYSKDKLDSFIREMIQNSNDARDKEKKDSDGNLLPLKLNIRLIEISKNQFPRFKEYLDIIKSVRDFHKGFGNDQFFKNVLSELEKEKITLLVVEDYNTTGLSGSDDDWQSTFYGLVIGDYLSIKQSKTAGGSHGIGKNAIVGLSRSRTVFFSSHNEDGEDIFMGFSKLATYKKDGEKKDRKIYYSGKNRSSVRDFEKLPEKFRDIFARTENGLSQFVVSPKLNENWVEDLEFSIIQNQWKLLKDGDIEVKIYNRGELKSELTKKNLIPILNKYYSPKKYNRRRDTKGYAYDYYKTLIEGKVIEKDLGKLGKLKFYYRETDHGKSKYTAFIRNGLVIKTEYKRGYGNISYCGVILCEGDEGNSLMRAMENPQHDTFIPGLLEEQEGTFSVKEGESLLEEMDNLIEKGLNKILEKYMGDGGEEEWLDDFFEQAIGDRNNKGQVRTGKESEEETTQRIGIDIDYGISLKTNETNTTINNTKGNLKKDGPGKRSGKSKGTKNKNKNKRKKQNKTIVNSRIYHSGTKLVSDNKKCNEYILHLNSDEEITNTDIEIVQQGDSGQEAIFKVINAKNNQGKKIDFNAQKDSKGAIKGYRLNNINVPSKIKFLVHEPYKSSFKVN